MRERIMKGICWLHAAMILSLVVPLLYSLGFSDELQSNALLYGKCFCIILPIALTYMTVQKCRSLVTFLLTGVLIVLGMTGGIWLLDGLLQASDVLRICDTVFMGLGTVLVIALRFVDRMRKLEEEREKDPYWQAKESFLNRPDFQGLWYFGIVYLLGLGFSSKNVCDEAFYSAIVYLFLIFIYRFIQGTEKYFSLNRGVSKLPRKRIYGISGAILGVFLLGLLLVMLPVTLTAQYRPYTDVREWFDHDEQMPQDWTLEYGSSAGEDTQGGMEWLLEGAEEPAQMPAWLDAFFKGIALLIFAGIFWAACRQLGEIFRNFRRSYDETGDTIEELDREQEEEYFLPRESISDAAKETAQIRRRYKREIRRRRRELPARFESPSELEANAGLCDEELHRLYEAARYARTDKI